MTAAVQANGNGLGFTMSLHDRPSLVKHDKIVLFPDELANRSSDRAYIALQGPQGLDISNYQVVLAFPFAPSGREVYAVLRVVRDDNEVVRAICSHKSAESPEAIFGSLIKTVEAEARKLVDDLTLDTVALRALRSTEEREKGDEKVSAHFAPPWTLAHVQTGHAVHPSRYFPDLLARGNAPILSSRSQEIRIPEQVFLRSAMKRHSSADLLSPPAPDKRFARHAYNPNHIPLIYSAGQIDMNGCGPRHTKSLGVLPHAAGNLQSNERSPGHARPLEHEAGNLQSYDRNPRRTKSSGALIHAAGHRRSNIRPNYQYQPECAPVWETTSAEDIVPESANLRPANGTHQLYYQTVRDGPPLPRRRAQQDPNVRFFQGPGGAKDIRAMPENYYEGGSKDLFPRLSREEMLQLPPSPELQVDHGIALYNNVQPVVTHDTKVWRASRAAAASSSSRFPGPRRTLLTRSGRTRDAASNTRRRNYEVLGPREELHFAAVPARYKMRTTSTAISTTASSVPALTSTLPSIGSPSSSQTPSLASMGVMEPAVTPVPPSPSPMFQTCNVEPLQCKKKVPDPNGRPVARVASMKSIPARPLVRNKSMKVVRSQQPSPGAADGQSSHTVA